MSRSVNADPLTAGCEKSLAEDNSFLLVLLLFAKAQFWYSSSAIMVQ